MAHLEDISADELRSCFDEVESKRPVLRLVAGINYKEGVAATTIADWYGVSESTVHNWLNRLERLRHESPEDVIYDAPRSGRPAKLSSDEWQELVEALDATPAETGIDEPRWTPRVVQQFIEDRFDTVYSKRHVQDILREARQS